MVRKNNGISLITHAIALSILAMLFNILGLYQVGYANATTVEEPPMQMIDDRQVSLEIKTDPPIITAQSNKAVEIQMRLYDRSTGETITHTTYLINLTKGFTTQSKPPLLTDMFHSHNGTLILRIEPTASAEEGISINGEREPILYTWLADERGMIEVRAPLFLHAAMYHLQVEIVTVDHDTNVLDLQALPRFDHWLNISENISRTIILDNQSYNATVISYFDRIENFTFSEEEKAFSWSVPFDWNISMIQDDQLFFVHQHLIIPKSFVKVGFGGETSNDTATPRVTINGVLNGSSLIVDPYSYENEVVYHILINKQKMLSLAEQVPADNQSRMTFAVSQNSNVIPEFGIGMLILVAAIIGMVVVIPRYQKIRTSV